MRKIQYLILICILFCGVNMVYAQCSSCTLTNPAVLPNPLPAGVTVCITTNQTYGGGLNMTGGSINICSGSKLRINGAVNISPTSQITLNGCSEFEINGNLNNNNAAGVVVIDNCNCATAVDVSGPIFGFPVVCSPLPVTLTSLTGHAMDSKNEIFWTTASEINSDYFIVEKSLDGIQYKDLGRIEAAENSNTEQHYTIEDENPFTPFTYYRLKQVDKDGSATYSELITIENVNIHELNVIDIHPNPSPGLFIVDLSSSQQENVTLSVTDQFGKIIYTTQVTISANEIKNVEIDAKEWATGLYLLDVTSGISGKTEVFKMIRGK